MTMKSPSPPQPGPSGRGFSDRPAPPLASRPETSVRHPSGAPSAPPGSPAHVGGSALQPAHSVLICVAAPRLAISAEDGQLKGEGLDGYYKSGRRVLSRCQLTLAGREPLPLQGRMVGAGRARFLAAAAGAIGGSPDPEITVERLRSAEGNERIVVHNAGERTVRLPLELRLATDLADLGAVAVGRSGHELPASVHGAGLAWGNGPLRAVVAVEPAPDVSLARTGLLRWEWELPPGAERTLSLTADLLRAESDSAPAGKAAREDGRTAAPPRGRPTAPWPKAYATGDDLRIGAMLRVGLDDVGALLQRDPASPADLHLAAGVPWRCALAPADSLRAARMLLPLGTRLAAGTLRTLARAQVAGPGPDTGRLPGPLRNAGPYAPPGSSGIEATLLFPAVLAEARRWGLPERDIEHLLPAAEACLHWLRSVAGDDGYVPDPAPDGPYRCEVQAHAHRAAVLGADLLDGCGRGGATELRDWAAGLRDRFREDFWYDDRSGGRPLALRTRTGGAVPNLGCTAAELLDTGLLGGGYLADGLLDKVQTEQLARLLAAPALDSGWGLRSLGSREPRHNAFGHRGGAVRVQETTTAVAGLASAGFEKEAGSLLFGVIDAAETFGWRLPEMYAAEQRTHGGVPVPHPAACRPAAIAAACPVQLLTALTGVRPDVPQGTVSLHPMSTAPLGAVEVTGLCVAEHAFSVRISRLGTGVIEEAAGGLQLVG